MAADQIETLKGLLERVRASTGPDRDLDLATYCAVMCEAYEWVEPHPMLGADKLWAKPLGDTTRWAPGNPFTLYTGSSLRDDGWGGMKTVPAFTQSVDSALGLVDRALPEWDADLHRSKGGFCIVSMTGPDFSDADMRQYAESGVRPTGGLAVCEALLSAKLALLTQEEGR